MVPSASNTRLISGGGTGTSGCMLKVAYAPMVRLSYAPMAEVGYSLRPTMS